MQTIQTCIKKKALSILLILYLIMKCEFVTITKICCLFKFLSGVTWNLKYHFVRKLTIIFSFRWIIEQKMREKFIFLFFYIIVLYDGIHAKQVDKKCKFISVLFAKASIIVCHSNYHKSLPLRIKFLGLFSLCKSLLFS